jgi:hypothetical protein
MIRGDERKQLGVRGDVLQRGSGLSGEVRGDASQAVVRDISAVTGSIRMSLHEEGPKKAVAELIDLIDGPVARAIFEIGRFIDGEGTYNGP